jgi:hypothetical protein
MPMEWNIIKQFIFVMNTDYVLCDVGTEIFILCNVDESNSSYG